MEVYKLGMVRGGAPTEASYFIVTDEKIVGVCKEKFIGIRYEGIEEVVSGENEIYWDVGHGINVTLTKIVGREAQEILDKINRGRTKT